jgi:DNA-3-methyladenine glycosylase I
MKRKALLPPATVKRSAHAAALSDSPRVPTSPAQMLWPSSATRCWSSDDPDMQPYHDSVWGRPETDESLLFRSQTLQLMQCGVSWATVWRKRQHFERAFKSYNVDAVAQFSDGDINDLMAWPDGTIIRNRSKLRAVVQNARVICSMRAEAASGTSLNLLLGAHAVTCD